MNAGDGGGGRGLIGVPQPSTGGGSEVHAVGRRRHVADRRPNVVHSRCGRSRTAAGPKRGVIDHEEQLGGIAAVASGQLCGRSGKGGDKFGSRCRAIGLPQVKDRQGALDAFGDKVNRISDRGQLADLRGNHIIRCDQVGQEQLGLGQHLGLILETGESTQVEIKDRYSGVSCSRRRDGQDFTGQVDDPIGDRAVSDRCNEGLTVAGQRREADVIAGLAVAKCGETVPTLVLSKFQCVASQVVGCRGRDVREDVRPACSTVNQEISRTGDRPIGDDLVSGCWDNRLAMGAIEYVHMAGIRLDRSQEPVSVSCADQDVREPVVVDVQPGRGWQRPETVKFGGTFNPGNDRIWINLVVIRFQRDRLAGLGDRVEDPGPTSLVVTEDLGRGRGDAGTGRRDRVGLPNHEIGLTILVVISGGDLQITNQGGCSEGLGRGLLDRDVGRLRRILKFGVNCCGTECRGITEEDKDAAQGVGGILAETSYSEVIETITVQVAQPKDTATK